MPSVHGLNSLLQGIRADLGRGLKVQVAGVSESLAELTLLGLWADGARRDAAGPAAWRKIVVVLPTAKDLTPWSHYLDHLQGARDDGAERHERLQAAVLPYFANWGNDRFINPSLARRQRIFALAKLAGRAPAVVLTTVQGLAQTTLAPPTFAGASLHLKEGDEWDQDELMQKLEDLGYGRATTVEEEGCFALRGGIIDIYPMSELHPVRLEFIGDTLSSLRYFSATDQKSIAAAERVVVAPASEAITPTERRKEDAQTLYNTLIEQNVKPADRDGMLKSFQQGARFAGFDMFAPLFRPEKAASFDYLNGEALLFFPSGIDACLETFADYYAQLDETYKKDVERERPSLPVSAHFLSPAEMRAKLEGCRRCVEFGNPYATASSALYRVESRLVKDGAPTTASIGAELFDKWFELMEAVVRKENGAVLILAHQDEQLDRVRNLVVHRGLTPVTSAHALFDLVEGRIEPGRIVLGRGDLTSHLWLDESATLVVPEQALFGARQRKPKPASAKLQNYLSSFMDLKVGDLVVHVQHGIGRYQGLTTLAVAGVTSDFLILEYAGSDKIYAPVDRLNLLQRYNVGSEGGHAHPLDKLGGPGWERRKSKVKGAVKDMAEQLLKLQARRAVAKGHAYPAPDDTYLKFEAEFPYEETEDQLRSIYDVDTDMRSGRPMDRLVCGDVGFGKTEVALRATMRTVLEGFQVLVLVPTTVLCYQHYRTFKSRLEGHGVRVAQVNRFVKGTELKAALDGLKEGKIDVLVGTHRILSSDIKPKRLGLLVVDEEQRFGVGHKEKLKDLRAGAHVLTLTATPIPRTLHMAMVGLRDISIIGTPPQDRLSVKTYISRFDETLIKDAIEQEIRRGGQVFFVHNRVDDIEAMRLFLKSLVPYADVRVAHGQMKEQQLEQVIVDFLEQKFHLLLCTTIIESGIDMPNVNTLIVNRADNFGLAQLYQLRGRVGRANLQAYAYFLTPVQDRLSEDGKKRLDVLAAYQELGAGFQIASHDLELRGAGNLLGGEQSGHAAAVGLELYTEMLEAAIHELRGEAVREQVDAEIKIPVSALIPPTFVPSENQRLHFYKSLFAAESDEALAALRKDIEDRFGQLPPEFALLFKVARLKQRLRRSNAARLTAGKDVFELRFAPLTAQQVDSLLKAVAHRPGRYKLSPDYKLFLPYVMAAKPSLNDQDKMLDELLSLLDPLAEAIAAP